MKFLSCIIAIAVASIASACDYQQVVVQQQVAQPVVVRQQVVQQQKIVQPVVVRQQVVQQHYVQPVVRQSFIQRQVVGSRIQVGLINLGGR